MRRRSLDAWTIAAPVLRHVVLGLGAVVMLAPFVLMISISLKPPGEVFAPSFSLLPRNLARLSRTTPRRSPSSRSRATCSTACSSASASSPRRRWSRVPCAYALAKLRLARPRADLRLRAARPADPAAGHRDPALHPAVEVRTARHLRGASSCPRPSRCSASS